MDSFRSFPPARLLACLLTRSLHPFNNPGNDGERLKVSREQLFLFFVLFRELVDEKRRGGILREESENQDTGEKMEREPRRRVD